MKTYNEIIKEGLVGNRQALVLHSIEDLGQCTDLMIMQNLGFTMPNQVRPRRKELLDKNFIVMCKKKTCPISGRKVKWWKINPEIRSRQLLLL